MILIMERVNSCGSETESLVYSMRLSEHWLQLMQTCKMHVIANVIASFVVCVDISSLLGVVDRPTCTSVTVSFPVASLCRVRMACKRVLHLVHAVNITIRALLFKTNDIVS